MQDRVVRRERAVGPDRQVAADPRGSQVATVRPVGMERMAAKVCVERRVRAAAPDQQEAVDTKGSQVATVHPARTERMAAAVPGERWEPLARLALKAFAE